MAPSHLAMYAVFETPLAEVKGVSFYSLQKGEAGREAKDAAGLTVVDRTEELRDFADGIHRCQDALAVRICRRAFPKGWPIKVEPMG